MSVSFCMQYALYYRLMQRSFLDTIFAAEILMDCCYRFIVLPVHPRPIVTMEH